MTASVYFGLASGSRTAAEDVPGNRQTRAETGTWSRRVGLAIAMFSITFGASGCATMKTTLRYRLTVVVDTPQGIRTGSSVVEVKGYLAAFPGLGNSGPHLSTRGEATPVALGNGKYLFAILSWVNSGEPTFPMLVTSFRDQLPPKNPDPEEANSSMMHEFRALSEARGIREVKPEDYPVIATFADRMKPYSIRIAPATELSSIMPGYRVVRMTVEITDDPVSRKISQILPWIQRGDLGFLNPDISANWLKPFPEYQKIGNSNFIRGIAFTKETEPNNKKDITL